MSASFKTKERHVIPRWRDSVITAALGELDSPSEEERSIAGADSALQEKIAAFETNPSPGFAADLVGAAMSLGEFEAGDSAATLLLNGDANVSETLKSIINRLRGIPRDQISENPAHFEKNFVGAIVRKARQTLQRDPHHAIAWIDLSRAYASLGSNRKASRAMRVALDLAPTVRFVLRSASRLGVHLGNNDEAHDLLRRNLSTRHDPWLVAAEIAAADLVGRTSRLVQTGRQMVKSGDFAPFHTAELASALGMLELKAGKGKAARKLFEQALTMPTENSLAQIEFASRRLSGFSITPAKYSTPFSHEARARYNFAAGLWQHAFDECVKWFVDEPFSSESATLASYIAAEQLQNHILAERASRDGLVASPNDPTLLNNLAFALANQGKLQDAEAIIARVDNQALSGPTDVCVTATRGFIKFRNGDKLGGEESYRLAIKKAQRIGLPKLSARAAINLAVEQIQSGNSYVDAIRDAAEMSNTERDVDLRGALRKLHGVALTRSDRTGETDRILDLIAELMKPVKPPIELEPISVPLM